MSSPHLLRLGKEIRMLAEDPPPGVVAWPVGDSLVRLEAQVTGPEGTPYAAGVWRLEVTVPSRYPFEPPKVRFATPIYHPNIDDGGRICLDTLKMQPAGSWSPSVNMSTLLTSIRLLMAHPNPDDGLMPDITEIYRKVRLGMLRARGAKLWRETGEGAFNTREDPRLLLEGTRESSLQGVRCVWSLRPPAAFRPYCPPSPPLVL
jgi:ubiquitin-conjugating enzyme E2 T